jgi:hypothetical protein
MVVKIKRSECLELYPKFPLSNNRLGKFYFPKTHKSYFLSAEPAARPRYISRLVKEISVLVEVMGFQSLIFLADTSRPWLYFSDPGFDVSKAESDAIKYLKSALIGLRFNGGLKVDPENMAVFLKHLYWLTSCNATLPIFHFMDEGQNIVGHICQYGVLHFSTLTNKSDDRFKAAIEEGKVRFLFNTKCMSPFSGQPLKGRRTAPG